MDNIDLTELLVSGSRHSINTCSLVLSAVDISHRIERDQGDFQLFVAEKDSQTGREQIDAYFVENENWPPPEHNHHLPQSQKENPPTILMMGGLALFYLITGPWLGTNPWFVRGAIDTAALVNNNEWWRLITALTLHADDVHLFGNIIIGGIMVHFLCRTLGHGTGWLLVITTGSLGNLCNVILRDARHLSVGFSTSVFAVIGIFTGYRILDQGSGISRFLAPLGAGVGLLAFLGSAGERTDLGAHFFGFVIGILVGIIVRFFRLNQYNNRIRLQRSLWAGSLVLIISSWLLALNKV